MKLKKLLLITASVCLLVFFVSGSAQAEELESIVDDYCHDVELTVAVTQQELIEAYKQGGGCVGEVQSCMDDLSRFDSASRCLRVFSQCAKLAQKAQLSACSDLLRGLEGATSTAEKSAKRNRVAVGFNNWLQGDSDIEPTSGDCLTEAYDLTEECYEE